jgi:hypothetical protein
VCGHGQTQHHPKDQQSGVDGRVVRRHANKI